MEWLALVRFSLPTDKVSQWNAVRLILASQHILYYSLHGENFDDDEWQVIIDRCMLTRSEVGVLKKYGGFKPYLTLTWAMAEAKSQTELKCRSDDSMNRDLGQGMREELIHSQFREVAFKFRGHCGQIINLLKEPVPFPYFHLLNVMLVTQLSLTAYALAAKMEWIFGVIMMVVVSVVLLGMRGLAVQLSNPFGDDSVDFSLETFMKGTFKNAIEYLREDQIRPSGNKLAEPSARNPLFPPEHRLGQTDGEKEVAWSRPNSKARKVLQSKLPARPDPGLGRPPAPLPPPAGYDLEGATSAVEVEPEPTYDL